MTPRQGALATAYLEDAPGDFGAANVVTAIVVSPLRRPHASPDRQCRQMWRMAIIPIAKSSSGATVTISQPEASMAATMAVLEENLPVPTRRREVKRRPAMMSWLRNRSRRF